MHIFHKRGILLVTVLLLAVIVAACGGGGGRVGDPPGGAGPTVPGPGNGDDPGDGNGGGPPGGDTDHCLEKDGCYVIKTLEQLESIGQGGFGGLSGSLKAHYVLGNTIDAKATSEPTWNSGVGFHPIGGEGLPFEGTFDGNGFKIKNLYIDGQAQVGDPKALFGVVTENAVIKNLYLENVSIIGRTPSEPVGGLVAINRRGTIQNVTVSGKVIGRASTGGIVGHNHGGTIENSHNRANIEGNDGYIGGIVGHNEAGTVKNATSKGTISGGGALGGLVGNNWGTISDSHSDVTVESAGGDIGGLAGFNNYAGIIEGSSSRGKVSGRATLAGGFVGQNSGKITESFSQTTVDVIGSGSSGYGGVGGFVGVHAEGQIANSYASGNVAAGQALDEFDNTYFGGELAGGFVGYADNGATIVNSYNSTGSITSEHIVGGLVGHNADATASNVANSYWQATSGVTGSAGGDELSSVEMGDATKFDNWDFAFVWEIVDGYPDLRNNPRQP